MSPAECLPTGALDDVDRVFAEIRATLQEWLPGLRAKLAAETHRWPLSGADLVGLVETDAHDILTSHAGRFHGAGFCADAELVSTGSPLAWWQGPRMELLSASSLDADQVAIDLRRLEWFRIPQATGRAHVAGPFVDYLCSNEITITSAEPVDIEGRFAGVACVDILVTDLEAELAEAMRTLGRDVSLVNSACRVVLSNDPRWVTGDAITVLEDPDSEEVLERIDSRRFPFSLVRLRG